VNIHVNEPATDPALQFLSVVLLSTGRTIQVLPRVGAGAGSSGIIVTLGDVLHILNELSTGKNSSTALRWGTYYFREGEKAVQVAWSRGLWTRMVHGGPAAGYIFIDEEDLVWGRC